MKVNISLEPLATLYIFRGIVTSNVKRFKRPQNQKLIKIEFERVKSLWSEVPHLNTMSSVSLLTLYNRPYVGV